MILSDTVTWLQSRTAFSSLETEVLAGIASHLQERTLAIYQTLILENEPVDGLYILRSGCLESNSQGFRSLGLLTGTIINLRALLLDRNALATVTTLSEANLWFIPKATFQELVQKYPAIAGILSQYLAREVAQLTEQLNLEQEKQTILRPYLVTRAKRGIVGKSRYAIRLRSQIQQAAENRYPVLIFGEPGLEKDNIAALIHYSSAHRHEVIIKVDCSKLSSSGSDLFGKVGGKIGLIEAVQSGTLVLNNIQELPIELRPSIAELLRSNIYRPIHREEEVIEEKYSQARLILISEQSLPKIDPLVGLLIKVPPLRVRKGDISDQISYYISLFSQQRGIKKPRVTPEALRKLQAYDFPNNLRELENLVERALVQLDKRTEITEEIIWPSQSKKKQFRVNLLNTYPQLRRFLRSDWWPTRINYGLTVVAFALLNIILFVAPQSRSENFALNLFWAWWWPLVLLSFPFLGRVWCAVCPFMIYGEITQKISLYLFPRQLKKWPRETAEKWGGWFLYGLFALILLWEELWNLEDTAYLSSCLLLLITAGAIIFSTIFERRFWCRYLCPIGGMNGMFAKLSITELRAQQGTCSAECNTYQCYKGGPSKGEGMESEGCPLYSHPAQLEDNRDCVLCMTCLKACPHRSVEFNLRPPAIELWTTHVPRSYEVALLFLLLGAVFLHHLPEIQSQLELPIDLSNFGQHSGLAIAVLFLPVLVPLLAHAGLKSIIRHFSSLKPRLFVELAYGYLPLVFMGNIAHYLQLGLGEAGKILPVALATFGLEGGNLPIFVAHPAVISFLQGTALSIGVLTSIFLTRKIAKQPYKLLVPQHVGTIVLALALRSIL
jgi:transcriptional regulator with AAA-type ATPase domain/NAD-dependent dihydropyrimidine dehydrogenase PreA subunit